MWRENVGTSNIMHKPKINSLRGELLVFLAITRSLKKKKSLQRSIELTQFYIFVYIHFRVIIGYRSGSRTWQKLNDANVVTTFTYIRGATILGNLGLLQKPPLIGPVLCSRHPASDIQNTHLHPRPSDSSGAARHSSALTTFRSLKQNSKFDFLRLHKCIIVR